MRIGTCLEVFIFVLAMSAWTYQQQALIIRFDPRNGRIQEDSRGVIYRFNPNRVSFQHDKERHRKQTVTRDSINADIVSYKELLERMSKSKKEFPKAYGDYDFFIAVEKGQNKFTLFEVEPVWIIDEAEH